MAATDPMQDLRGLVERQTAKAAVDGLAQRIREMATRWQYSSDERADALRLVVEDPEGWCRLCDHDEAAHGTGIEW